MKKAGDVFSALFDERQLAKAGRYDSFLSCWKELAEKNGIAAAGAHSWIKSLDKGLVWIEVDHPGWKQILQTKESKLLHDFRCRFPEMEISGISITLARKPASSPHYPDAQGSAGDLSAKEEPPSEQPPPASVFEDGGYEAIKDHSLREALMRLERSIREREGIKQP